MQKLWQKKLELNYSKSVIDIVQFGSSVLSENYNDIDIAVIFEKIPAREQLEEAQKIKNQIRKNSEKDIHIKSYDFYSFFERGNFAREGILFYGKSLITGKNFAERFGLNPKVQIKYILNNLEKKDKIRFNYMLNGKGGEYGLFKRFGGKIISPGIMEISPENEKIFLENIKKLTNKIEIKRVFSY